VLDSGRSPGKISSFLAINKLIDNFYKKGIAVLK
jgi:hypothetical protein